MKDRAETMESVETLPGDREVTAGSTFADGLKDVWPLLLGIFPFAVIAGSVAVAKGMDIPASFGFSLVIFAGASQLAALELMGDNAPILIVVLTAWIVNLRFLIYSAAIAPHLRSQPFRWKVVMAYLLTDQAFVLSMSRFQSKSGGIQKRWYFLGVAMALWTTWQTGSAVGILLGANVPPSLSLDFAVPLSFIALVVPTLKDKASVVAGAVSGISVLMLASLPLNLGLVAAVIAGMIAGTIVDRSEG